MIFKEVRNDCSADGNEMVGVWMSGGKWTGWNGLWIECERVEYGSIEGGLKQIESNMGQSIPKPNPTQPIFPPHTEQGEK